LLQVTAAAGFGPEGESGFGDEGFARCGLRVVFGEPVLFDFTPERFVFAGQDGRSGAAAVLDGIQVRLMRFGHNAQEYRMPSVLWGGKTGGKWLRAAEIETSCKW